MPIDEIYDEDGVFDYEVRRSGRVSAYDRKYCDEIIDHFADADVEIYIDDSSRERVRPFKMPTLTAFARARGITRRAIDKWVDKYPEFKAAYKEAMAIREELMAVAGMAGATNAAMTKFALSHWHGWRERTESTSYNVDLTHALPEAKRVELIRQEQALLAEVVDHE